MVVEVWVTLSCFVENVVFCIKIFTNKQISNPSFQRWALITPRRTFSMRSNWETGWDFSLSPRNCRFWAPLIVCYGHWIAKASDSWEEIDVSMKPQLPNLWRNGIFSCLLSTWFLLMCIQIPCLCSHLFIFTMQGFQAPHSRSQINLGAGEPVSLKCPIFISFCWILEEWFHLCSELIRDVKSKMLKDARSTESSAMY